MMKWSGDGVGDGVDRDDNLDDAWRDDYADPLNFPLLERRITSTNMIILDGTWSRFTQIFGPSVNKPLDFELSMNKPLG